MALQEIQLQLYDKQKIETREFREFHSGASLGLGISIKASKHLDFLRQLSPRDITCSLFISLDIGHWAVTVAKCFSSHQIISAVTLFSALVEVGKGCYYICQCSKVTLAWVLLLRRGQLLSNILITELLPETTGTKLVHSKLIRTRLHQWTCNEFCLFV